MALICPIMINETTIGSIVVTRQEKLTLGRDEYRYKWEVVLNPIGTRGHPIVDRMGGGLVHNYSDGALVLIAKVLELATAKV